MMWGGVVVSGGWRQAAAQGGGQVWPVVTPPKLAAQRTRVANCFSARCGGGPMASSCRIARRLLRWRAVASAKS